MLFIQKKLIPVYKKKNVIYTKLKSNVITRDVLGKTFIIYNGKKWLRKDIDSAYYLYKSIGSLKNLDTRKLSVFKSKKKKKKRKKILVLKN